MCAHLVKEHGLVREDVGGIAAVVVEVTQLGVEEARRTRRWHHPRRVDLGDVLAAAVHLTLPLLGAERLLGPRGHVVHHRVPDRARVLQHVHVDLPEIGVQHFEVDGARVIHVEAHRFSVVDHQTGVSDRAVGRSAQRDDHHVEIALWPAHPVLDRVRRLEESMETDFLEFALQVGHRVVGQQHDRVLVDVVAQVLRVEVVAVQMRDVQVVDVAEGVPVQRAVVGEREPRCEVRRVDPRVAQDASGPGVDPETGVPDARDLH
jgi:hypothetical protein